MLSIKTQTIAISVIIALCTIFQTMYLKRAMRPKEIEPLQKQLVSRYFVNKDSIGWRLIKEFPGHQPGSGTVVYDRYPDSISLVNDLRATVKLKEAFIKADAYVGEIADLNRLISSMTGTPDASLPKSKEELTQSLPGKWVIVSGKDSMHITITAFLTVTGPGIQGAVEAVDNKSILLKKVLPADTKFDFVNKVTMSGEGVMMRKE